MEMALIENQIIKVKWHSGNKKHYISKGYIFTKIGDEFEVKAEDLSDNSSYEVMCYCDNPECDKVFPRKYGSFVRANRQSFCSKECASASEKRIKHTKESLIEDFWRYYKEFKKFPLSNDFKINKNYPDLNVIRKHFGSWLNYLKEVGVVDKNNIDGWYIHDEALLRKYYPYNQIEEITKKLMIKRTPQTIRQKANEMGIK